MWRFLTVGFLVAVSSAASLPPGKSDDNKAFWREAPMESAVHELRVKCSQRNDYSSCLKFKVLTLLDEIFKKDSYKVSEAITIVRNSFKPSEKPSEGEARSHDDKILNEVEEYIQSHDLLVKLPGSTINFSPRDIDNNELKFSFIIDQQQETSVVSDEARRSKFKKIFLPIAVFMLLKAITLVPFFIGALGLKAWNALQLSFFSFVISVALAIFQLCRKFAADASPPQIVAAPGGWESNAAIYRSARSVDSHNLAFRAYSQR